MRAAPAARQPSSTNLTPPSPTPAGTLTLRPPKKSSPPPAATPIPRPSSKSSPPPASAPSPSEAFPQYPSGHNCYGRCARCMYKRPHQSILRIISFIFHFYLVLYLYFYIMDLFCNFANRKPKYFYNSSRFSVHSISS